MLPGQRWLTHPRFGWVVVALGLALGATTLGQGFFADDFAFLARLESHDETGAPPTAWTLYEFADGDPAKIHDAVRHGPYPWWTAPELRLRFFRPLSSALFALDHRVFGRWALGYHVHALLWWLALLVGVGLLLRRTLSAPIWQLAFLMFALSASHREPVGWLASRHVVLAATLAVWGMLAVVDQPRHRRTWFVVAVAMVAALLGGEGAVSGLLYWMAYEAVGAPAPDRWRVRARRMLTPALITAGYLVIYKRLGYGSSHNSTYVDPLGHPLRYLLAAAQRVPAMLGEQFASVPSDVAATLAPGILAAVGLVVTGVVGLTLRLGWVTLEPSDRRALRWLALGACGSLLVSAGSYPGSRLLMIPGLGGYAIVAASIVGTWARIGARREGRVLARTYVSAMLFLHLIASPLLFVASASAVAGFGVQTSAIDVSLDDLMGPPGRPPAIPKHVYVLCSSDPMASFYVGVVRSTRAPTTFAGWNLLSMTRATHRIARRDERTLVITLDRPMLGSMFEQVFHAVEDPFLVGQTTDLDDGRVTVLATSEGRPTEFEVRFNLPLDDPKLLFLAWRENRLVKVDLPPPGAVLEIPWSPGPTGLF